MPSLLVSGFVPFGAEPRNPSGEIAARLEGTRVGPFTVHSLVLPVARDHAFPSVARAIAHWQPAAVLALGLGVDRPVIGVERFARNLDDYREADQSGAHPRGERIVAQGPERLRATLPEDRVASAIRAAGIPAAVSEDAGTYLCNHLFYRLLHLGTQAPKRYRSIFLHLPPLPECVAARVETRPSMALDACELAVRRALESIVSILAEEDPPPGQAR